MSVELPPLPEPVRTSSDQAYLGFTADQMQAYVRAAVDAALERAAQECEAQISGSDYAYLATHGHWDHMAQSATNCADAIRALKSEGA